MNFNALTHDDIDSFLYMGNKTMSSTTWTQLEINELYRLTNLIYNGSRVDTGCSSCRRTEVQALKRAYIEYQKIKQTNGR